MLGDDAGARVEARSIARNARTNAQASIERLRGEPRPDRVLLAFAEGVFANANRFIRACMSLDAILHNAPALPARESAMDVATRMDAMLAAIAHHLRDNAPIPIDEGSLRAHERAFAAQWAINGARPDAVRPGTRT